MLASSERPVWFSWPILIGRFQCGYQPDRPAFGEKYQLIDVILKGVLQSLFMAGIVNAEPAQMLQVLESHFQEKRIGLFIDRFSLGLKLAKRKPDSNRL